MCGISSPLPLSKTQRSHWPPRSWSVVIYFLCKHLPGSNSTIRIFGEGNKTLHRHEENCNTEVHGGGDLQLVKPARKPASSRSEPGASPKNLPRRLACSPLRVGSWSEISFPPRNLPVDAFEFRAQGFSISLARQGTRFPLPSSTFYGTLKRALRPTRLSTTFPPPLACYPLSEQAHLVNTIRNQPNCRHVLTAGPIGKNNQIVLFLEGESSRIPNQPERPFPTQTPKPDFRGRRREMMDAVSSNHKRLDAVCVISAFLLRMKTQRLIGLPRLILVHRCVVIEKSLTGHDISRLYSNKP